MKCKGGRELLELESYNKSVKAKYWVIGIIYILVLASFLLVLFPQLQAKANLRENIASELEERELLTMVINRRAEVEQLLDENNQLIKTYEQQIPHTSDLPVVLLSIQELADLAGLKIDRLQYGAIRRDPSVTWYPISLEITGQYASIYKFIQAFNRYLPSARVRSVKLVSETEKLVSLNCELNLYTIPDNFETTNRWETPTWRLSNDSIRDAFGVPLVELEEFYDGSLALLGVVSDGSQNRALVSFQGVEQWKTVGSYVGIGRVTRIQSHSITLDINGFTITVSMGG